MKPKLDVLFIVMLLAIPAWTQMHADGLPLFAIIGFVSVFGSFLASPRKRAKRQPRVVEVNVR